MNFYFQYLCTRSGKAVLLFFDKKRYLFNCFEGLQRYSIENKVKLGSLDAVFLCSMESVPPFIGAYLTLGDMGRDSVNVICPWKYESVFSCAKAFANRKKLKCCFSQSYADRLISVEMVCAEDECTYVVSLPKIRGKFLAERVPKEIPKRLYSELSGRMTVEFNGEMYDGNNFLEEDVHPEKVAIVYSTKNYDTIKNKLSKLAVKNFIVFHKECAEHLERHLEGTFYVLSDTSFVEFKAFYNIQAKANQIDENYLLPMPSNVVEDSTEEDRRHKKLKTRMLYIDSCDALAFNKEKNGYDIRRGSHLQYIPCSVMSSDRPAPHLVFLGTGCAVPSKYRNVSSIMVQTYDFVYLLDCGEDTLYQINRAFGSFEILKRLEFIFISHSHADHHLGLASVLSKCRAFGVVVKVVGPGCVKVFLETYFGDVFFEFYETDRASRLKKAFYDRSLPFDSIQSFSMKFDFGFTISVCGVHHCADSCGIAVDAGGLALAYSGDTAPDPFFKALSAGCEVVIHEATFGNEMADRAKATKHSTVDDALAVWEHSKAKKLVLTHFSQRYKAYLLSKENVTLASDLLLYFPRKVESQEKKSRISSLFNQNI